MEILDEVSVKELKVIHRPCVKCYIWKIHIKEKRRAVSLWAVNNFVIVRMVDVLTAFN